MNDCVMAAMSKSAEAFSHIVWPAIKSHCNDGDIVPVELRHDSKINQLLDINAGVDVWQVVYNNGQTYIRGIASRVQGPTPGYPNGKNWQSFTIRYKLRSKHTTEFAKRMWVIEHPDHGYVFPALTVQAYIDKWGPEAILLGAAVTRTIDLYTFIKNGKEGVDYVIQTNPADGNEFIAVFWDKYKEAGNKIAVVEPDDIDV